MSTPNEMWLGQLAKPVSSPEVPQSNPSGCFQRQSTPQAASPYQPRLSLGQSGHAFDRGMHQHDALVFPLAHPGVGPACSKGGVV